MKAEPIGKLCLEPTNSIGLGLTSRDSTKLKLISSYLLSKPTLPTTKAAITCLKIPLTNHLVDKVPCLGM